MIFLEKRVEVLEQVVLLVGYNYLASLSLISLTLLKREYLKPACTGLVMMQRLRQFLKIIVIPTSPLLY